MRFQADALRRGAGRWIKLFFVAKLGFFDGHVFELAGFKDVAAFLALYVLGIFVPGDDLHARVFAEFWADFFLRRLRRLGRGHKLRGVSIVHTGLEVAFTESWGIL